jgi:SAM-dependent methyltransferase
LISAAKPIDTPRFAAQLRAQAIDVNGRRVLISRLAGSGQEVDLTLPANCHGYPTELLASLDRLAAQQSINPLAALSIRRQSTVKDVQVVEGRSFLPLPHPLDFEWRFAPDASRALLDEAAGLTLPGADLLLFGTPGLAIEALTFPTRRRVTFLAESNSVTDRVAALNHAMGCPLDIAFCDAGLPRNSADAVLLDPPWYLDYARPMLAAAAHACRPGGVVLISLPPDGARPTAEADRRITVDFGRRLGLTLSEHRPLAIDYETPFFERNALTAAGLIAPPRWRRGDLVVFRKTAAPIRPPTASGHDRRWMDIAIGRMRLFIRSGAGDQGGEIGLIPVVEGDVLPTVSRRDPRRRLADVWTSGNRIFRTDNFQLLLEAAISCAGPGIEPSLWGTLRDIEAVERVATALRDLADLEAAEERGAPLVALERSVTWKSSSMNSWSRSTATLSG